MTCRQPPFGERCLISPLVGKIRRTLILYSIKVKTESILFARERIFFMFHISKVYTVESVTAGHPDKVCDQISDAILDECLAQDSMSRVAVETFGGHGLLVIGGEVTTQAHVDYEAVARRVYRDIGYTDELRVITNVVEQSRDIAQGVDTGGAGDQGIMYGFACDETPEFLPHGLVLAHNLTCGLDGLRKSGKISWLYPDGKTQVTMEGDRVKTILVSAQHNPEISQDEIRADIVRELILPFNNLTKLLKGDVEVLVNPTGVFVRGGFDADTGLTGRKIMVDTYGGLAPHGGGAFSGKDPTKVDRSAAYMCRFVAKNIVAHGFAHACLVSVAYAIGRAEPLMTHAINEKGESLAELVKNNFDFRPAAIIERLMLRRPLYRATATYGHFGHGAHPWEQRSALL